MTLVLTVVTGCGASARDAVELARARWANATGLTRPMPRIVEVHGLFKCKLMSPRGARQWASGCWNEATQTLILDVDYGRLQWAALHEWGHVLGAGDGRPGTLMCHSADCSKPYITQQDVWKVCDGPNGPCRIERPEVLTPPIILPESIVTEAWQTESTTRIAPMSLASGAP